MGRSPVATTAKLCWQPCPTGTCHKLLRLSFGCGLNRAAQEDWVCLRIVLTDGPPVRHTVRLCCLCCFCKLHPASLQGVLSCRRQWPGTTSLALHA